MAQEVTFTISSQSVNFEISAVSTSYIATTYNIYVNGVLDQSFTVNALENQTINITA